MLVFMSLSSGFDGWKCTEGIRGCQAPLFDPRIVFAANCGLVLRSAAIDFVGAIVCLVAVSVARIEQYGGGGFGYVADCVGHVRSPAVRVSNVCTVHT